MITEKQPQKVLTGRAVKHRKTRVDEVHSLDVVDMHRAGFFDSKLGDLWTSRSRDRGSRVYSESGYAMLSRELDQARVGFFSAWPPESEFRLEYTIGLTTTDCYFGGVRWWFECPGEGLDNACLGRCRILYRASGSHQFRCRTCSDLTYESRQAHRSYWLEVISPLLKWLRKDRYRPCELLTGGELEESATELKRLLNHQKTFKRFQETSS